MKTRTFHIASDEEVRRGETTDIYFIRTNDILRAKKLWKTPVVAEVTTNKLPRGWTWGILSGVDEEAHLFEKRDINIDIMPEGSVFFAHDSRGMREPIMRIEGPYGVFCRFETPLLGLLCQASGITTAAAHVKKSVGKGIAVSFGARRIHPALSPLLGRAAYIGGLDGVSNVAAAKRLGIKPTGTMPHSLIVVFGNQVDAWRAFDEIMPEDVPRIMLVDTYFDEKTESIMAAKDLQGKLWGVRLDTPGSRKGNFAEIVREVRWELDVRGYKDVKIFVSGGLDDKAIKELSEAGADGFGVGTWISNAPVIDFAMDIVEKKGQLVAKRGKLGGKKQVWRCENCLVDIVLPDKDGAPTCQRCGFETRPMLRPFIRSGKLVADLPSPDEIREYVLRQLEKLLPE